MKKEDKGCDHKWKDIKEGELRWVNMCSPSQEAPVKLKKPLQYCTQCYKFRDKPNNHKK